MNILKFVLMLVLTGFSNKVLAWGESGHGAVGYIADKNLTPQARAFIHKIIGIEALAVASVWPDEARSDERFANFSEYHYMDIPPAYTFSTLPERMRAPRDADTIISQVPSLLVGSSLNREQKMILLRYLVHVVGDVHQPLHIGNSFDRGGNACKVKLLNPSSGRVEETTLHYVWDDKLITSLRPVGKTGWYGYKEFAELVLSEENVDFKSFVQTKPSEWYDESQKLHSEVYPDKKSKEKVSYRPYCDNPPSKIPTLDNAYVKNSLTIIKKRILLAGYRLAGLINKMAEDASSAERTLADDIKELEPITLKNAKK